MLVTVLDYTGLVIGIIGGAVIVWGAAVAVVKLVRGEAVRLRERKLGALGTCVGTSGFISCWASSS